MTEEKITFETFHEGDEANVPYRMGEDPTETIDLTGLDLESLGPQPPVPHIGSTSVGKLLHALPTPVLLVEASLAIKFANEAWARVSRDYKTIEGSSIRSLFLDEQAANTIERLLAAVFETRDPQTAQGVVRVNAGNIFGRMHLRSLRMSGQRYVLMVVEDLTAEKRQLLQKERHERELRKSHEELEKRVKERTAELERSNEQLRAEIGQRRQSEGKLKATISTLQGTLNGVIIALASLAEKRDPHIAGHHRRVAQLAGAIAQEMVLGEDRTKATAIAAAIHDIGKIIIPTEFLTKPGGISNPEYEIIKNHVQVGYDILKEIDFPWPLAEIVLHHHERMNGSGYPQGTKGEDIRLEARILGVADVVEAMSSHRPYRPALGMNKATEEISRNRGVLYDPDVVAACLSLLKKGFEFL